MISGKPARSRKRFGQHFLHDRNVVERIIDIVDFSPGKTLVEIGPGRGVLTAPLLERSGTLHAIEVDRDLAGELGRSLAAGGEGLILYCEDALKFDFSRRIRGKLNIVGNLPYNISTPLLFHLLDHLGCIDQMVLMLQNEVADRICADPGNREYGRLSIMVQSLCEVRKLCSVSAGAFNPPPKVESAVIELTPHRRSGHVIRDYKWFSRIVRTAFSQRRKTVRNALKQYVDEKDLADAGIPPSSRPEQIPVSTYIRLANQARPDR